VKSVPRVLPDMMEPPKEKWANRCAAGPQAGRSFAGREKEVNRYYASRPGPAGRVNRSDHTGRRG
ncbi:hypothetical protein, partial [Burkholderia sp. E168m23]|uniref:hypothetical protein n=1 Tax=Burkholderia sp. E168m23 TaxID=1561200 RepID=UPI001F26B8B3